MRRDIENILKNYSRKELKLLNKSEIARRFNCDPRTVDRYIKIQSGDIKPKKSSRKYVSLIDDYKSIIIDKVDTGLMSILWTQKVKLFYATPLASNSH